jgi:hypothetical protein
VGRKTRTHGAERLTREWGRWLLSALKYAGLRKLLEENGARAVEMFGARGGRRWEMFEHPRRKRREEVSGGAAELFFCHFRMGNWQFRARGRGTAPCARPPAARSRRLCYTTPSLMWEKSGGAEELGCTRSVGLIAGPVKAIPHSVVVVVQPFEHFQPTVKEAIYF